MRLVIAVIIAVLAVSTVWLTYRQFVDPYRTNISLQPLFSGSFADPVWRNRWAIREGEFNQRDVQWIGKGALANIAVMRDEISGATAIDCDGEVLAGSIPCDLSALWYENVTFSPDGTKAISGNPAMKFQIGAYDNSFSGIIDGQTGSVLASSPFTLAVGRRYHVRAEFLDATARLLIDGVLLCEYRIPFPAGAGRWALYSFYPGKAFSNVVISAQPFTPLLHASAVADSLAAHGHFAQAGSEYMRVADGLKDAPPAALSRLRAAMCFERADRRDEADIAWRAVAQGPYAGRATLNTLERRAHDGEPLAPLLGELGALQKTGNTELVVLCARTWERWFIQLRSGPHTVAEADAFLSAWRAWAHLEPLVERQAAGALLSLRREEEVIATLGTNRGMINAVMMRMGRGEEALGHLPEHSTDRAIALLTLGRYDEAIPHAPNWLVPYILKEAGRYDEVYRDWPDHRAAVAECLQRQGRNAEIVEKYHDLTEPAARALCALNRGDEALALPSLTHALHRELLIRLGRLDEAAALTVADPIQEQTLYACRAWEALAAGDVDSARTLLQPQCRWIFDLPDQGRLRWLVGPCALALAGNRDGLAETLSTARAEVGGAYRGELGRQIDALINPQPNSDPELSQPTRSWLLIAGLQADLANQKDIARGHYTAYLNMNSDADPALNRFVAWRLTAP